MAKFNDVLADASKYPDATEWTLPDGTKTTVGDMRTELRNTFIPKEDFTRGQQKAADERRQLEQNYQVELYKSQQAAEQLRAQIAKNGGRQADAGDDLDTYIADPTFGPMARKLKTSLERSEALQREMEAGKQRMAEYEQHLWLNQHAQVLRRIQDTDADMKDSGKVNDFLQYAKQNQLSNLDTAYSLYTRNRDIERAKESASKDAYERAKAELSAPPVPTGANQNGQSAATHTALPASLDDAENLAKADPEIAKMLEHVT
jgi:hypothetical protein